jgi:hypothetical protein
MENNMMLLEVDPSEAAAEFPIIKKWVKKISKLSLNGEKPGLESVGVYYSYGFFVGKSKNTEEALRDSYEKTSEMLFGERLSHEMKKVRVFITIKHKDFMMTDKLPKREVPERIRKIVGEIVKAKMLVEFEYNKNQKVRESIPDIDKSIAEVEIVTNRKEIEEYEEQASFDIDSILDKIAEKGIDSLSEEERDFLDKKSRGA